MNIINRLLGRQQGNRVELGEITSFDGRVYWQDNKPFRGTATEWLNHIKYPFNSNPYNQGWLVVKKVDGYFEVSLRLEYSDPALSSMGTSQDRFHLVKQGRSYFFTPSKQGEAFSFKTAQAAKKWALTSWERQHVSLHVRPAIDWKAYSQARREDAKSSRERRARRRN